MKPVARRLLAWLGLGLMVPALGLALYVAVFGVQALINDGAPTPGARAAALKLRVVTVASGLENPWSLAFLPDGRMLVSERPGRLRIVGGSGRLSPPLTGVPRVHAEGQGGLLDVAIDPDFARNRLLYLSYAEPDAVNPALSGTAVARARLEGMALADVRVIFRQRPKVESDNHWGSRLVIVPGQDGTRPVLFITLGERFAYKDLAQDLGTDLGKLVRINTDGSIPADNPFVRNPAVRPEIWSYGHRNMQGAALNPVTGQLWTTEHGPRGGDELNIPRPGLNYGWPVISHGRDYVTRQPVGEGTAKPGMEQPVWTWTPSIGPSGLTFLTSSRYPAWRGDLFVGALAHQQLVRLTLDGNRVTGEQRLLGDLGERIRDVRQGPDGLLYLLTDSENGRILRLDPQ